MTTQRYRKNILHINAGAYVYAFHFVKGDSATLRKDIIVIYDSKKTASPCEITVTLHMTTSFIVAMVIKM